MVYNPGMANLPSTDLRNAKDLKLMEAVANGWKPEALAKRLHPDNRPKRRRTLHRIYALLGSDPDYMNLQSAVAQGIMVAGLPEVAAALVRRAKTGRPDAIKLTYESTRFWSPRQQHEHSGEIRIKLEGMPRPTPVEDITDADVIE